MNRCGPGLREHATKLVQEFDSGGDGLTEKSRELILHLLTYSDEPLSRHQFAPGHITCTAAVLHPARDRVLLVHHGRLRRWLLPGGHVEEGDVTLADAARREAIEETNVRVSAAASARLVGIDVHGIPGKGAEPYHLHHDLIFGMMAESDGIEPTDEAPDVVWCAFDRFAEYQLPACIRRCANEFRWLK